MGIKIDAAKRPCLLNDQFGLGRWAEGRFRLWAERRMNKSGMARRGQDLLSRPGRL